MEKCNIAYFVRFKCEEGKHYNSNRLLCQRCCVLCTSYGEYQEARTCEDLRGAPTGFFIPLREELQQRISFYKI